MKALSVRGDAPVSGVVLTKIAPDTTVVNFRTLATRCVSDYRGMYDARARGLHYIHQPLLPKGCTTEELLTAAHLLR
jgi:hypothetical protein